jgi:hypothetical protein
MRSRLHGSGSGTHRIKQLRPGDEHHASAGEGEDHAARSRIKLDVVTRTFDCADGDCIDDQPRLQARLDREESPDFVQHRHSLTVERVIRGFEPFPR